MKKLLVIGLLSSIFSAGAFAAIAAGACTATIAAAGNATSTTTVGSATTPAAGEQCVCDGNVAGKQPVNGGPTTQVGTPVFVKTGFDVQCSNNTIVSYNEVSGTGFAVASGSRKGNRTFKGSSAGGGVSEVKSSESTTAICLTTGCDAANVTAANVVATANANGS
ncbi:MAG: hypothetical protein WBH09_09850 [Rugosibacter sp.]